MQNKKSPLGEVKGNFQAKEKLVEKLLASAKKREGESKDEFKKRLLKVSNSKLLKLNKRFGDK